MDASTLMERCAHAFSTCRYLEGERDALIAAKAQILVHIERDERYVNRAKDISQAIGRAQEIIQCGDKAVFERLLTRLLREVIPDSEDSVELHYAVRRNRPYLNVMLRTPKGLEHISNKGGSVRQIISMGLRFIVLTKTPNRRFLAFDEADSWISSERQYMSSVATVLCDMAQKAGVQVIYCTHHRPEIFEESANVIRLYRDSAGTIKTVRSGTDEDIVVTGWDGEADVAEWGQGLGLRHVRLLNFKAHKDTWVKLSPGVNVISGDMDLGKSSIIDALNAVITNRGDVSLIRHDAGAAMVEIGLEGGMVLRWSQKRAGSQRVEYALLDEAGEPIYEHRGGQSAPDWLDECLSMPKIQDIDVHIQRQDQPLFMIGSETSAHVRARLLSIGEDGVRARRLFAIHDEWLRDARRRIRENTAALADVKNRLAALRGLEGLGARLQAIKQGLGSIAASQTDLTEMARIGQQLKRAKQRDAVFRAMPRPDLDSVDVYDLAESIASARELGDFIAHHARAVSIDSVMSKLRALRIPPMPQIDDQRDMQDFLQRWEQAREAAYRSAAELAQKRKALRQADEHLAMAVHEAGDICPTCMRPWQPGSEHATPASRTQRGEGGLHNPPCEVGR